MKLAVANAASKNVPLAICQLNQVMVYEAISSPSSSLEFHLSDAILAQFIELVPMSFNYCCTVREPALLHLAQLLRAETQTPKNMNHLFVSSIVQILAIQVVQAWRSEQSRR